mgnify:FL=1
MITSELGVLIMGTLWGILILIPMISLLRMRHVSKMIDSFLLPIEEIDLKTGPLELYIKEEEYR